jgi:tripartite-type tricarboxylate transporter receptor subunit TctC
MRRPILLALLLGSTAPALCAQTSPADTFPSKPIRILVGFTPGGGPDITARLLSGKLNESWKQAVVVENLLGAGDRGTWFGY